MKIRPNLEKTHNNEDLKNDSRASGLSRDRGKVQANKNVKGKERRAHEGCLGSRRRRRTRQAAIGRAEGQIPVDARISEWGNPPGAIPASPEGGGEPGELKHLSTRRKRKQTSDSASSGERKRRSPNRGRRKAPRGVVGPPLKRPMKASGTGWKAGP